MTSSGLDGGESLRRFLLVHLSPALVLTIGLLLMEFTRLDRLVSDQFYNATARTFPLRHEFLFDVVLHHWAKYFVTSIAILVAGTWLASFLVRGLRPWRRLLLFLTLAMSLAPGMVVILKYSIHRYCPWDLDIYGGVAPYLTLLESFATPRPSGVAPTHCFPAGHAATGFCLLAFYFAGLALRRPRLARAGLWTGIVAGLLLGTGRIAQGAHFLSHNLWTGVICWTVMVILYVLIFDLRSRANHELHASRDDPAVPIRASVERDEKR